MTHIFIMRVNKKYLEKAVAVKGIVTEINANQIIVDNNIVCDLKTKNLKKTNKSLTSKKLPIKV